MRSGTRVVLALLLAFMPAGVLAYTSPGQPQGYVNDFAGILSNETQQALETNLQMFEASTTIQIAVVTVDSLGGDAIETYSIALAREWAIGQKGSNNGVLFLIAPTEHQVRIEIGYGLEGAIPDIQAGKIIDDVVTPAFKEGNFDEGVANGVAALELLSQGETFDSVVPATQDTEGWFTVLIIVFVFGVNILSFLGALFARSKSWWLGGVVGAGGGAIVALLFGFIYVGLVSIIILSVIGMIFDYIASTAYQKYREGGSTPPWFLGGPSSSSGSSSSGGFGGGSFGGGGASGSW